MFKRKIYTQLLKTSLTKNRHNLNYFSTVFDKIISKEIKSEIVYEDGDVLAFKDINPAAPIHVLIIPKDKQGLEGISKANNSHIELLGKMLLSAKIIADNLNLANGYRIVINEGKHGCQSINHIHLHLMGGKQFGWPPGTDISTGKNKL